VDDVANGDAFKRNDSAILEAGGVGKVQRSSMLASEQAARGAGHEKDDGDQQGERGQNQRSHLKLRPLNLFAAWHVIPLAELSGSTP
jgi:hypothetical protein